MTETISILVIFFVLMLFGFMFYSNFQKRALLTEQQELIAKRAVVNSLKTTFLNEFRCEQTEPSGTCIDLVKFGIFKNNLELDDELEAYYSNVFSTSRIYIVDIIKNTTINLYDNPRINYTKLTSVQTPVLLRNVTYMLNNERVTWDSFGVLHVDYYHK